MAHDPWTKILSVPSPLCHYIKQVKHRYWVPLVEIWHVDPETDGTEYSCQNRLRRKHDDVYVHTCWRFWHWRLRFPIIHYLVRWIRGRCGLCGKSFRMHAGTCGGIASSKHEYHPKCYDIVARRFHDVLYQKNPCGFIRNDGYLCQNIASVLVSVMDTEGNYREVKRCWEHVPRKAATRPIEFREHVKVNGM